jgi:hypothetical protein
MIARSKDGLCIFLWFSRCRSPIVSPSRPQIGNRYGARSALLDDVVSFYPASPKDAKGAAIWRRIAEVPCERALRVSGPALIQQLAVEAVQDWLQTVRDAEVVVNLAQVVNDDLLGGANLVSD